MRPIIARLRAVTKPDATTSPGLIVMSKSDYQEYLDFALAKNVRNHYEENNYKLDDSSGDLKFNLNGRIPVKAVAYKGIPCITTTDYKLFKSYTSTNYRVVML